MVKKMLNTIIKNGKDEDMEALGDIFMEMAHHLKACDYARFKDLKHKMYTIAYGEHLTEDLAKAWVSEMENKDGTHGEHWTMEQTNQYAENYNKADWYAVMNMMFSDYYNPDFNAETYIKLAKDWIGDKDVADGKTLRYYMYVVDCNK